MVAHDPLALLRIGRRRLETGPFGALVVAEGAGGGTLGERGHGTELLKQGEQVGDTPVLHDPAVGDPEGPRRRPRGATACRLDAEEGTEVSAAPGHARGHDVALGHHVLDGEGDVRKRLAEHGRHRPHAFEAIGGTGRPAVVDVVRTEQLVDGVEVATVDDLLHEAPVHRLVGVDVAPRLNLAHQRVSRHGLCSFLVAP